MPKHIDERKVLTEIYIEKDADGIHPPRDEALSVEIVSYGEAFEPYQSHFARELSDEGIGAHLHIQDPSKWTAE